MKKLLFLLFAISIISCQKETKDYVIFSGKVINVNSEKGLVTGHNIKEEFEIAEDGTFKDTLRIPVAGYYTYKIGNEYATFYLKNGADVELSIDTEKFDESITYQGEGALPNNYLAAKYMANEKFNEQNADLLKIGEEEFLSKIEGLNKDIEAKLNVEGMPEDFIELEKKNLVLDNTVLLNRYATYHGRVAGLPNYTPSENFKKHVVEIDLDNGADVETYATYSQLVVSDFYEQLNPYMASESDSLPYVAIQAVKQKKDTTVQQLLMDQLAYEITPGKESQSSYYFHELNELSTDEEFKEKILEKYTLVKKLAKGSKSPEFNYENYNGGDTSLSSFAGKYVYVDVWATWCGPCKREIPYLKSIEEEYHNKNIEFVSISIDREKDHETWKKFVKENELKGVQLFADNDWNSEFVRAYGIDGIPRFLLIDTEGKIYNADAPRPSNPKLKELLNSLEKI